MAFTENFVLVLEYCFSQNVHFFFSSDTLLKKNCQNGECRKREAIYKKSQVVIGWKELMRERVGLIERL